ncbi:MAG: TolC family outer membrane protein [Spongiibacteraceae bacterium]
MKGLLRPLSFGIALLLAQPGHSDTLRDIYDLALKNDPKLRAAAATFRANQETEVQARSRLLPQVGADASYGWTHREQEAQGVIAGAGAVFDFRPGDQRSELDARDRTWGVSLSQPLLDLPAWFSFQSGKELSKQAEAQFAYEQQDVIVRVAQAYFAVLRAGDNLRASLAEERATKRQFDQTQKRFDVGLIAITDVHEARAAFDSTIAQRLIDEGDVARAYEALTALTGQSHTNLWVLNKDFPVTEPVPAARDEWVDFALKNNYALKAAFYGMAAAGENAEAKRMEHLPKITGNLSYQDDSLRGDQDYSPASIFATDPDADTTTSAAMLKLTVPIFTGGYTSSARRQAAEQYNTALERRIETERSTVQATRSQHIAVSTDIQRVKARSQSIISAQSAVDATSAGYEVGTRNVVDVLVAQRTLYNNARDYANARYDYVLDTLKLKQQAGTLTPQDIADLDTWLVAPDSPTARTFQNFTDQSQLMDDDTTAPATEENLQPAPAATPPREPINPRQSGKPQQR